MKKSVAVGFEQGCPVSVLNVLCPGWCCDHLIQVRRKEVKLAAKQPLRTNFGTPGLEDR